MKTKPLAHLYAHLYAHLEALCKPKRIVCERRGRKIELTTPDGGTTAECSTVAEAIDTVQSDPTFAALPVVVAKPAPAPAPKFSDEQPELQFRMFRAIYHGPGNVRGSRIIIHDLRHGNRKAINYGDHGRTFEQATAYLRSIGITVDALGLANSDKDCMILSLDMATPLK